MVAAVRGGPVWKEEAFWGIKLSQGLFGPWCYGCVQLSEVSEWNPFQCVQRTPWLKRESHKHMHAVSVQRGGMRLCKSTVGNPASAPWAWLRAEVSEELGRHSDRCPGNGCPRRGSTSKVLHSKLAMFTGENGRQQGWLGPSGALVKILYLQLMNH